MDDRFVELTEQYAEIRRQLDEQVKLLVLSLAVTADRLYPDKVVGALLFVGVADIRFVEGFAPDYGTDDWQTLRDQMTEVENMVRSGRRHGIETTLTVVLDDHREPVAGPRP